MRREFGVSADKESWYWILYEPKIALLPEVPDNCVTLMQLLTHSNAHPTVSGRWHLCSRSLDA